MEQIIKALLAVVIGVAAAMIYFYGTNKLLDIIFPSETKDPAQGVRNLRISGMIRPWLFLLPALLSLGIYLVYPVFASLWYSVHGPSGDTYVGAANYVWMFNDSEFRESMFNNMLWLIFVPALSTFFGLIIAWLTDRIWWGSFAKMMIFMPMAISFVGASVIWKFVYDYRGDGADQIGILNAIIVAMGGEPHVWIAMPFWNNFFLMIILLWIQTGFAMVLLSAALRGIPEETIEAAVIARELGRPVQLVWSRWQEMIASPPRAPAAAEIGARLGRDGSIVAMTARIAMPPSMREQGARLFDNRTTWAAREDTQGRADPLALSGAVPAYGIPNFAVDHVPVDIGLPVARMRGGGDALTAFFTESFVDELAEALGREKLSYRIAMLGQDLRMVEVLQRAARLAEWSGGDIANGQGLACHRMQLGTRSGRIACVAQASPAEGGVRVERLSVAADIGRIVNRDLARQQIEGGLIFGLSLALGAAADYAGGLPRTGRLAALNLPRLADSPEIAIDLVDSDDPPFDPGELGTVIAAPAIANALASATGQRYRTLPLALGGAQPS